MNHLFLITDAIARGQQADQKAESEYDEFKKTQKIISDFDKEIKKLQQKGGNNNE
jgi:hypothetical protein